MFLRHLFQSLSAKQVSRLTRLCTKLLVRFLLHSISMKRAQYGILPLCSYVFQIPSTLSRNHTKKQNKYGRSEDQRSKQTHSFKSHSLFLMMNWWSRNLPTRFFKSRPQLVWEMHLQYGGCFKQVSVKSHTFVHCPAGIFSASSCSLRMKAFDIYPVASANIFETQHATRSLGNLMILHLSLRQYCDILGI